MAVCVAVYVAVFLAMFAAVSVIVCVMTCVALCWGAGGRVCAAVRAAVRVACVWRAVSVAQQRVHAVTSPSQLQWINACREAPFALRCRDAALPSLDDGEDSNCAQTVRQSAV